MSTLKKLKAYKAGKPNTKKIAVKTIEPTKGLLKEGEFKLVPISAIDASPFNYRNHFPEAELKELADDIARHGIISNLTIRLLSSGRYELVVGERRLKAAVMAGIKEVPANVVSLTDQEAMEIQLSENLQRSDPHPMQEALAIERFQKQSASIEEIAARIGKSRVFVYGRLKLLSLIEPFREIFLSGKCSAQQAFEIAAISPESQSEFYEEYCADWQADEDFEMPDTKYVLNQFKYDLTEAPFNIDDKNLVPEAGTCTNCPFNSATTKSLFPELETAAVCTKRECYQNKCRVSLAVTIRECFEEHKPEALLFYGSPDKAAVVTEIMPEAVSLPRYNYNHVRIIQKPEPPERQDCPGEGEIEDTAEGLSEDERFELAFQEYGDDMEQYRSLIESGKYRKGLLLTGSSAAIVFFDPEERANDNLPIISTAKDLQAAIRSGNVTSALLQSEMNRMLIREERAQELDREKVQLKVHEQFESRMAEIKLKPSAADLVAVRLILFQSLGYSARIKALQTLFGDSENPVFGNGAELYQQLENLTDVQFAYLIHMAVASHSDSKTPKTETGYFLYKMAEQDGLDLDAIEAEQKEKTDKRQQRLQERMAGLQKQIQKLQPKE